MKLARVFCFLIILGSSAIAAYAQTPVDPKAIISIPMAGGDPPCGGSGPICVTANSASDPLMIPYSATFSGDFEYCPPASDSCTVPVTGYSLSEFFLEFTGVPGTVSFGCQTNIFVDCGISNPSTGVRLFTLDGGPGPCNYNDGIGGTCPGILYPAVVVDVTNVPLISETPETDSIILFGTGLISFFMAAKRRFHART